MGPSSWKTRTVPSQRPVASELCSKATTLSNNVTTAITCASAASGQAVPSDAKQARQSSVNLSESQHLPCHHSITLDCFRPKGDRGDRGRRELCS